MVSYCWSGFRHWIWCVAFTLCKICKQLKIDNVHAVEFLIETLVQSICAMKKEGHFTKACLSGRFSSHIKSREAIMFITGKTGIIWWKAAQSVHKQHGYGQRGRQSNQYWWHWNCQQNSGIINLMQFNVAGGNNHYWRLILSCHIIWCTNFACLLMMIWFS